MAEPILSQPCREWNCRLPIFSPHSDPHREVRYEMIKEDGERRVLIVDESEESREVLRTILERRGWEIVDTAEPRQGLTLADHCQPDLIVLDLETLPHEDGSLRDQYDRQSQQSSTPIVLLGTTRVSQQRRAAGAKPYHYGPLVRTIEALLRQSQETPST